MKKEQKKFTLQVRVTREWKRRLDRLATAQRRTPSDFIRRLVEDLATAKGE